jgi:hypothetical protein
MINKNKERLTAEDAEDAAKGLLMDDVDRKSPIINRQSNILFFSASSAVQFPV